MLHGEPWRRRWDSILRSDSLMLIHILEKRISIPWAYEVRLIRDLLSRSDCKLMHTYRENNMATDFLANLGFREKAFKLFEGSDIPSLLRGIVRPGG